MLLSEAIALGRTLVEARNGAEFFWDGSGCARGMALEAIGKRKKEELDAGNGSNMIEREWPWLALPINGSCPCNGHPCDGRGWTFNGILVHLFDSHVFGRCDWTLDQLIDWVKSVEPQEAEKGRRLRVEPSEAPAEVPLAESICVKV